MYLNQIHYWIVNRIFITLLAIIASNYSWSSLLDGKYNLLVQTDCFIAITINNNQHISIVIKRKYNRNRETIILLNYLTG